MSDAYHVLDEHYLAISALVTIGIQFVCFLFCWFCKFDTITDFSAATNFIIIMLLSLILGNTYSTRAVVNTAMACVSRLFLAGLLLYRVCKRGKDSRFDEAHEMLIKMVIFWVAQAVWVFIVSLPVLYVNGDRQAVDVPLGAADYVGWGVWGVGFIAEVWSDLVKLRFRSNSDNRGKVCNEQIWGWSRHGNYFGEIAMWWGIFISSMSIYNVSNSVVVTILSPLYTMFLLLAFSGIPFAEGSALKRWYDKPDGGQQWEDYRESTAPVIPVPPVIYRNLPSGLKTVLCCECPCYVYKPEEQKIVAPAASEEPTATERAEEPIATEPV